jgi:ribonuclease H
MSPFQEDEASPHHQEVVTDDHSVVLAEMLDGSDSIDTNNNSNNTVTVTVTVPSSPSDETTTTTSTISTNSTRKETHHDLLYESNRHSKKYSSSSSSINYHHHSKKKCCYGKALRDKDETKAMIGALIVENRLPLANVYGNGPILVSNIPQSCLPQQQQQKKTTTTTSANTFSTTNSTPDIILGIDEAGRGSVMGPMVYGAAYWSTSLEETIPKGFRDSKTLKEEDRFRLFEEVLNHKEIGFAVRAILPSEISRNMLRPSHEVYNLNEMSHDAAIVLIRTIVESGVTIKTAYIDTVGSPTYYARKLQREFPTIAFVVESKADAKYPPCSAASVGTYPKRERESLLLLLCLNLYLYGLYCCYSEERTMARGRHRHRRMILCMCDTCFVSH